MLSVIFTNNLTEELKSKLTSRDKVFLLSDKNCFHFHQDEVKKFVWDLEIILEDPQADLVYADALLQRIANNVGSSIDKCALVSIGSGTICDLGKYIRSKLKILLIHVATAPSMNGYLSASVSLRDGVKKSFQATIPDTIYIDRSKLNDIPDRLFKAGVGDGFARAMAQVDYYLGSIYEQLNYDHKIYTNSLIYERQFIESVRKNASKEILAEQLYKLLFAQGEAMTKSGGSYPFSQSEHAFVHLYEEQYPAKAAKFLHGELVAISTIYLRKIFKENLVKFDRESVEKITSFSENNIEEIFQTLNVEFDPKKLELEGEEIKDILTKIPTLRARYSFLKRI